MHRLLWGPAIVAVIALGGCGVQGDGSQPPSAEPPPTSEVTPSTEVPTPPFSPAIPTPPPEVTCEVTEASAETEYGELVSGESADPTTQLTMWSVGDILNELDIVLVAYDSSAPSIHLVLHVLTEGGYTVLTAQLLWLDGRQEELFVNDVQPDGQRVTVIFGGNKERWIELTVEC